MTDKEADSFREYLLKGGFVIFDDFRGDDWDNLQTQMRACCPTCAGSSSNGSPVFHSFFEIRIRGTGAAYD